MYVLCRTVYDEVQDSVSLSVECSAPAQIDVFADGCVFYAVHVDVGHQACRCVVLAGVYQSGEPFQLMGVCYFVESVCRGCHVVHVNDAADAAEAVFELVRAEEAGWWFGFLEEPEALVVGAYCCQIGLDVLVVLVPVQGDARRAVECQVGVVGACHAEAVGSFCRG